jgi:hypothetical protein
VTVLLLTLISGVIGTGAWFTDQDVLAGNSMAAGYLDISIRAGNATKSPIVLQGMEPGVWSQAFPINVYNSGSTIPVKYRLLVSGHQGALMDQLDVRLAHFHCLPVSADWTRMPSRVKYSGPLANMYVESPTSAINKGVLEVNRTHCWMVSFKVRESAGNEYKNSWAGFDLVVEATQLDNPGWGE